MQDKTSPIISISNWIRDHIKNGEFPVGSKIYSEPQLAKMFSVNRYTVREAIKILTEEGLLSRMHGSGTYVADVDHQKKESVGSKTIGVVITFADNYIFPSIIRGISDCLSASGYTMNLAISYNQIANEERILQSMLDHNCDGLIIEPIKSALPKINQALYTKITKKIPCVLINCDYPGMSLPYIVPNNQRAAELATNYLIERGHQQIMGIFKMDDVVGLYRYEGYARALQAHGLPYVDQNIFWMTTEDFSTFFETHEKALLDGLDACTAAICYNDQISLDFIHFLGKHGKHIPDDISLISFDDSLISQMEVPLTTVAHPKSVLGEKAASNLIRLIEDPSFDATYEFEPELIERDSVKSI